ncbi:MAG: 4'-phosphopantetheinyl transferase superfamily protein, partial [Pyrinomonadaceae bacterium]
MKTAIMAVWQDIWKGAPARPSIAGAEAHVWRANLNQESSNMRALHATLSPDEQERASKFHFQKDQHHYIVARGVLRDILSRYLDMCARS